VKRTCLQSLVLIYFIPIDSKILCSKYNPLIRLNCVTLSETGNIMACGMADSSIKVFIFDVSQHDVITMKDLGSEPVD
jgi:hypothetical protein